MKLLTLGSTVSLAMFGLVACDMMGGGGGEATAPTTPPAAADAAPAPEAAPADADAVPAKPEQTPAMACADLVAAAKAKDDAKFMANSTDVTAQALADAATKDTIFTLLSNATCGDATVDGEKAVVPVTAGADKRDVPFVKMGDAWKFDSAEYMNKYPPAPEKGKKGKKAKAGKKKKG